MGNCQAAEMAAAVVEYPGGRVERVMELQQGAAVSAQRLMAAYPGYFVALISSSIVQPSSAAHAAPPMATPPIRPPSFKLLAPDAPLRSGHRYRLLSFEEVLTCFSQGGGAYANSGRSPAYSAMNANRRLASKQHHLKEGHSREARSLPPHVVKIGC